MPANLGGGAPLKKHAIHNRLLRPGKRDDPSFDCSHILNGLLTHPALALGVAKSTV
jgi:hypothetical protein